MTYGNRNPKPKPHDEDDEQFRTVRIAEPQTVYGVPIHRFSVVFAAADLSEPNARGVDATMLDLADAIQEAGYSLQSRELREAASEFTRNRT